MGTIRSVFCFAALNIPPSPTLSHVTTIACCHCGLVSGHTHAPVPFPSESWQARAPRGAAGRGVRSRGR